MDLSNKKKVLEIENLMKKNKFEKILASNRKISMNQNYKIKKSDTVNVIYKKK